jgi:glutamate--cysteine ligase
MAASSAVAEATKPLTKADLVAYLASGCKTRDKWRCGLM